MATALLLLIPAATATVGAESAQQSTVSDSVKSDAARPAADNAGQAPPANQAPSATQMQPDSQARPKSLTDKAIEKVKQVAKTASDIFSRVPC
ncbi:MAG: hypothetical protein WAM83_04200, partial [Bradyrhizobium sp.]